MTDLQQTGLEYNKVKGKVFSQIKKIKIKPADVAVTAIVLLLVCLVVVPSLVRCVINLHTTECQQHMNKMMDALSISIQEEPNGGYMHTLIADGDYGKLVEALNTAAEDDSKFSPLDYYITTGYDSLLIKCGKHTDADGKSLRFSLLKNVKVNVARKPRLTMPIAYLSVSGTDTYDLDYALDSTRPSKMKFSGMETDGVIDNLKVIAVYAGGASEKLNRNQYTVTAQELDMTRKGETKLSVRANRTSLWNNSAYAGFTISVTERPDERLVVDAGDSGKYELAAWDWQDFVYEASLEDGSKTFGASIVRYNGKYYYYPNGMRIINDRSNTNPFDFAFDTDDESKSAHCIEFDTDSVILTESDGDKIHNGSVMAEDELVYIWQDTAAKDLPAGWIRVYCELKKY